MLFIFLLASMQLSWGFFLSSLLFWATLCQQKEKRFVLVAAEYRCLPFGLSPGYQGSVAEERKEEGRGAKLQYYQLCLLMPSRQERLEPMQQATVPVQLSPGVAT